MSIPQSQLETWSHQGSVTQSANTYATVKRALESSGAAYAGRPIEIFLQGSYGNDTNIYAESDVDVVILCSSVFYEDIKALPPTQVATYHSSFSAGAYAYSDFKRDVHNALLSAFPNAVTLSNRALKVAANNSRRPTDVIAACEFRRYYNFVSSSDESHDSGVCFFPLSGSMIVNYPKQHSANLIVKQKATRNNFKPIVRIFKNLRSKLAEDNIIGNGTAPSYFIEGLLYNAPVECFSGDYENIVLNILKWLYSTPDRSNFLCANEQYYLLRDGAAECWSTSDGARFINSAIDLWNNWKP